MFQSTGICEQLQFRQIRRLFTFYRQKFLYSIIGLSNFTPFRCLLKGVKLGILLLSNGRACLGFNSIKASAIVCRLRSGVPKWQFLKYLWLCGMEILGYKTACCHKLRRWLFGPFWESDDCLLYYPSLKENFGCHVTRSKKGSISREEERDPWERGWPNNKNKSRAKTKLCILLRLNMAAEWLKVYLPLVIISVDKTQKLVFTSHRSSISFFRYLTPHLFSAPPGSSICPTREIKVDSPDKMKGGFYSPSFPNFYPDNQECTLTLDVPDNYKTVVWFQKFSLQCKNDKVTACL